MMISHRHSLEEQAALVSRYVAGDLSRSERAEFEAWLVASPELAAEVEMERRLRRGIASAARRGWLNRDGSRQVARERRWRFALAASVVGAVAVAWSVFMPTREAELPAVARTTAASAGLASSVVSIRLGAVRSASGAPDISLSQASAPGTLVFEPDVVVLTCEDGTLELECAGGAAPQTPQYAEYELDLVNRQRTTLAWRSPRQEPAGRTQLSFSLRDPGSLDAGDYDVIVRGHSADHEEVVARFWLRVTAQ